MNRIKRCLKCGVLFKKPNNEYLKQWKNRKYCSRKCYADSIRGRPNPRNKEWQENLTKSLKRSYKNGRKAYFLGKKRPDFSEKFKEMWRKGLIKRKKLYGNNNPAWRGGLTKLEKRIRECEKYEKWRKQIFERDDYTCQNCRKKGGRLHAHHIKAFVKLLKENNISTLKEALNCEELWDIDNGKTLCKRCHILTESYAKKLWNYQNQLVF